MALHVKFFIVQDHGDRLFYIVTTLVTEFMVADGSQGVSSRCVDLVLSEYSHLSCATVKHNFKNAMRIVLYYPKMK